MSRAEAQRRNRELLMRLILFCLIGVAVNLFFSKMAIILEIPLYLDNVGIILSSALGGYIPGIAVGYLTNIINGISDPITAYYSTISVINAVIAGFVAHRGWFRKPHTIILSILLFAVSGGILGSILTWFLYGFDFGGGISANVVHAIYESGLKNEFLAQLTGDFAIDIIDKAITVGFVLIGLFLAKKFRFDHVDIGWWQQRPLSDQEKKEYSIKRSRSVSLRGKMALIISLALIVMGFVTTAISYTLYNNSVPDASIADKLAFLAKIISLFIGFFILIIVVCIYFAEYSIVYPVQAMSDAATKLAFSFDTPNEEGAKVIKDLDVHTGDEIEDLYLALSKTSEDIVEHVNKVEMQKETITRMQNSLITVLANMVESRDKYTGDHVRKTAAYSRIILEELRKEGIYADQITDDFIYDVVNLSPLHDIGKIKVSDTLLNKPARLEPEEFKSMQQHTIAGSQILAEAEDAVSESSYLEEARNLAEYHHEKWDGSGYPHGLSGEDIPLSARIMAVADVFDALVSKRSYKEGFPLDTAFDIIRDGAGSHFDPKIAQAFLNAKDRVIEVAQSHRKTEEEEIRETK